MTINNSKTAYLALAATVVATAGIEAQALEYGPLVAEFTIEIENDSLFKSTDSDNELNDTYATFEAALALAIGQSSSLNAGLVFEPITDATHDRFFEDHGLYVEELFFSHDFGPADLKLGKFNPAFGVAWDEAPGIFGADFAEDYQLTEQLGAEVLIPIAIGESENVLSFAAFQNDRTVFSDSLGRERGQTSRGDGGPGNTSGPESFALSLAGKWGETTYNIGIQNLAKGRGDSHDQTGAVLGVAHTYDVGIPLALLAETAYFSDFGGSGAAAHYSTVGLATPIGPVTVSGVYSARDMSGERTDHLATLSGEMELAPGLFGSLGYRWAREDEDKNQTIGTLITYEF